MIDTAIVAPASGDTPANGQVVGNTISRSPAIFWGPAADTYPLGPATGIADRIGHHRAYFLISPSWHREDPRAVAADRDHVRSAQAKYPEHRFLFLIATRKELQNYRDAGVPAIICTYTAFVDDTTFDIDPSATKDFDAIYLAVIGAYKRHELCRAVASLALIYGRHADARTQDAGYVDRIRSLLSHATWINELDGNYRHFKSGEVAHWLNRARVGLCLSAHEGAMRAATEYLFCGLPVVSTPNVGGRDRVADPRYWIEVEPDADAVAAAVAELAGRNLDPQMVRQSTIEKIGADRTRLINLIAAIFAEEGIAFPRDADWMQLFRRGAWPFKTGATILSETAVADTRKS